MNLTLSLNTNPLVNRFAEPDDLIQTVATEIGIRDLQLTHEFINPGWPGSVVKRMTKQMKSVLDRTGVRVTSGMTGPYGRLNHFGHPDREVREYYITWFKDFADICAELGARSLGTQFAIFTYRDFDDPIRREALIDIAIDCWGDVAEHAKRAGLDYVFWEPMSIGREFGHTIEQCMALQNRIEQSSLPLPMWMMADIDHGDVTSTNPDDIDPYAWARSVATKSPIIHIKQSTLDKSGHRPFTVKHNENGLIQPQQLLNALKDGNAINNEICLELSFKEREPSDRRVIKDIAESVSFWAPYINTGSSYLNV